MSGSWPVWFLLLMLQFCNAWAVNLDIRFEGYDTESGLSSDVVFDVLQDQQGYLWVGTSNGLNRYDGYQFTVYAHDPRNDYSIPSGAVSSLYIDSANRFWLGTFGYGFGRFDPVSEQFTRYILDDETVRGLNVFEIIEGPKGYIWIATSKGLKRLDTQTKEVVNYKHDGADPQSIVHNLARTIHFDRLGRLWIGTWGGGISVLDVSASKFTHIVAPQQGHADFQSRLTSNIIIDLYFDRQNRLWIASADGLSRLDNWQQYPSSSPKFSHFYGKPSGPVNFSLVQHSSIMEDSFGRIWFGRYKALKIIDKNDDVMIVKPDEQQRFGLNGNYIYRLFEDQQKRLWIATSKGLNKVNLLNQQFTSVSQLTDKPSGQVYDLQDYSFVSAILKQQNETLWLGTRQGLFKMSPSKEVEHFTFAQTERGLGQSFVHSLLESDEQQVWVSTHGGLHHYQASTNQFVSFYHSADDPSSISHNDINISFKDSKGNLWFGGENGLSRYVQESNDFVSYFTHAKKQHRVVITSMLESKAGAFWLGTQNGGLIHFNPIDGTYQRYVQNPELNDVTSYNRINQIYEQQQDVLWMTTNSGFYRFVKSQQSFELIDLGEFTKRAIYGLMVDNHNRLWFYPANAIIRFEPETKSYRVYDQKYASNIKGLGVIGSGESTQFINSDGEFIIGGQNGLVSFDPSIIVADTSRVNTVLTGLLLANKRLENLAELTGIQGSIEQLDALVFNYQQNIFSLEFAALNVNRPDKIQYAYQLENFDHDWMVTTATDRKATYTNLPAGDYVFKVKATNNDGIWSEQVKHLNITVLPPPWMTWWAKSLYVLLCVGVFYYFYITQQHKLEYQQQVNRRLQQVDKLKDDFLANTSHELRTPLTKLRLKANFPSV